MKITVASVVFLMGFVVGVSADRMCLRSGPYVVDTEEKVAASLVLRGMEYEFHRVDPDPDERRVVGVHVKPAGDVRTWDELSRVSVLYMSRNHVVITPKSRVCIDDDWDVATYGNFELHGDPEEIRRIIAVLSN